MAIGWASRLVALLFLLLFQALSITGEMVFFRTKQNGLTTDSEHQHPEQTCSCVTSMITKTKKILQMPDISHTLVPLLSTTLSAIIVAVVFSGAGDTYRVTEQACKTNLDADISGVGVRASIWVQIGMLILISGSGHLHKQETGIKEVGAGLILTHVSLAIALIVQMYRRTLTSVDAGIGTVILDAQNVALLIPVTAKQTLAARWQVIILIPTQVLGLVFLPVLIVKFTKGNFASEDCDCLNLFWWSRLSDCAKFPENELTLFWVYYTLRWIMWFRSTFHSMYNAEWFHRSEKKGRVPLLSNDGLNPNSDEAMAREKLDPERLVERATIPAGFLYKEYSATISFSHTTYALYSLVSMAIGEVTIKKYNLQPSSHVYSIGQIIAIVVSLATFIRAVWSFQSLYIGAKIKKSFPDLVFDSIWWRPWKCCASSRADKKGKGATSNTNTDAGVGFQGGSDTPGHDSSPRTQPSRPPTPPSPSIREDLGPSRRYLSPPSGSPGQGSSRSSSFRTNGREPQTASPLDQYGDTTRLSSNRTQPELHQSMSRRPKYRFEFRQPFHLDAVKQIFLPNLTRKLRARKESRPHDTIRENLVSSAQVTPTLVHTTADATPGQLERDIRQGEALLTDSAAEIHPATEALTSGDDRKPEMPSNDLLSNLIRPDKMPGASLLLEDAQPEIKQATERGKPDSLEHNLLPVIQANEVPAKTSISGDDENFPISPVASPLAPVQAVPMPEALRHLDDTNQPTSRQEPGISDSRSGTIHGNAPDPIQTTAQPLPTDSQAVSPSSAAQEAKVSNPSSPQTSTPAIEENISGISKGTHTQPAPRTQPDIQPPSASQSEIQPVVATTPQHHPDENTKLKEPPAIPQTHPTIHHETRTRLHRPLHLRSKYFSRWRRQAAKSLHLPSIPHRTREKSGDNLSRGPIPTFHPKNTKQDTDIKLQNPLVAISPQVAKPSSLLNVPKFNLPRSPERVATRRPSAGEITPCIVSRPSSICTH